jgi:hypothetical protein
VIELLKKQCKVLVVDGEPDINMSFKLTLETSLVIKNFVEDDRER